MSDTTDMTHFKKHINLCIGVFLGLLVLTVATVLISRVDLGKPVNITIALIVATFKACLVAAFFMHLKGEKRSIYRVLYFTFTFFGVLIFLTLWAFHDFVRF